MKILSAKTDDEGALQVASAQALASHCDADAWLQRVRKCSIELLWNIMLNVARDNNSKHSERMEGLSKCDAAAAAAASVLRSPPFTNAIVSSLASDASSLPPSDNP